MPAVRRRGSAAGFELGEAGLQGFQLLARAGEHFALHLEFFARDEIEAGEEAVEEGAGVLFEVAAGPLAAISARRAERSSRIFGSSMA